jgi:ABC-2 type transport system ATP-binding protein
VSRSAGAPVIDARGLTRRFGELVAVDGVDLSVQRGEIFGCLGPNGSGKSTLMRMLLGLLAPSDGSARVLGREMPREAEQLRPVVGYMTQRFSLYEDLDVRENLEFAAEISGLARRRRQERIAAALARHGLDASSKPRRWRSSSSCPRCCSRASCSPSRRCRGRPSGSAS